MIITIDGPAGSGKSTVANILANKLGFIHFNSGALFRGITAYLFTNNFNIENITQNSALLEMDLTVEMINKTQHVFVNGIDFTHLLRDNNISNLVAHVALNKNCRKIVDGCQKQFCSQNNCVIDGRDIGSFVFPNAEVKFYLDCSIKERARRRFAEEQAKNTFVTLEEIENQIAERDEMDRKREVAPLVIPQNAIIVDSSTLTIDQVVEKMLKNIEDFMQSNR
jgi:cytidylate kinase